ncbi:MAG: glycosyltransferase, partial [Burkholderiales bacterium]|nr:glycosyltransferase [Burkholderiales bacterium]
DGFSTAAAEAMAAGVIVFATAHGSNAEFVRHGWNGFLVRALDGQPDLGQAEHLLASYLRAPERFEAVRANAMREVPTWDEQAAAWERTWAR